MIIPPLERPIDEMSLDEVRELARRQKVNSLNPVGCH